MKTELLTIRNKIEDRVISMIKRMSKNLIINGRTYSLLSTLLSKAELIGIEGMVRDEYSYEEKIDAISYLVFLLKDRKLDKGEIDLPNAELIVSDRINYLVLLACQIRQIDEWSAQMDLLNYECDVANGKVSIYHKNEMVGKVYRDGYVRNQYYTIMAAQEHHYEFKDKEKVSYKDFFEFIFNKYTIDDIAIKQTDQGFTRFVIKIDAEIIAFIAVLEGLFEEEYMMVNASYREYVFDTDPHEFLDMKIKDDLTVKDYIIARRFSVFISEVYKRLYEKHKKDKKEIKALLNILSPTKPINQLKEEYENFLPSRGSKFIDFICYDFEMRGIRDLFYQQAVESKGYVILLNTLMANSNFPRNIIKQLKKDSASKQNSDGSNDRLVNDLVDNLKKIGLNPRNNISIGTTDIDLIFEIDEMVCVAECKNNVYPSDIFEFRTTLDHINKSMSQLSKIKKHLDDVKKRTALLTKLGYGDKKEIVYFTITSNRIMSNNNLYDFPVRTAFEMINYIKRGFIRIKDGTFRLWKNEKLTSEDFKNFLSNSFVSNRLFIESLQPIEKRIDFDGASISFKDFVFNWHLFNEKSKELFGSEAFNEDFLN